MIIYVLINIAVVLGVLGLDLYKHQFKLKFSSVLIAITINALINAIVIDKFNFITLCSIAFYMLVGTSILLESSTLYTCNLRV